MHLTQSKKLILLLGSGAFLMYYFNVFKQWKYPPRAEKYRALIEKAERENNLPKNLLARLLQQESDFNPDAHNVGSNAQGIAQIVPRWHSEIDNPFDPEQAIPYAGKYLRTLYNNFKYWDLTLAAYNWGWGNVNRLIAGRGRKGFNHMPTETKNYVAGILADVRTIG